MKEEKYLSVKEFAAAAEVSTQYIYKLVGNNLKPYVKRINKKIMINSAAIEFLKNGFNSTFATDSTNLFQPSENASLQPIQPTNQQTNATLFPTITTSTELKEQNGELQALKNMIEELKQDKEELKKDKEQLIKDKEDLKQESLKWQQLLIEERNKVKLLEDKTTEQKRDNIINIEEKKKKKSVFNKFKQIFKK